jgi:hypothetical protein
MSAVEATARQRDFTTTLAQSAKENGALELWPWNFEPCFIVQAMIVAQAGKEQKPTVGFSARFFWEGSDRRLPLRRSGLRSKKSHKREKTRNKVLNISGETPDLLPKRGQFRR